MKTLPELFARNRAWASGQTAADPDFFRRLSGIQRPGYLWIGCADSRVPANVIVGLDPGELFVQRNIANLVRLDDDNCMAVVEYAIEALGVRHVIVCGHYGCGGVKAVLGGGADGAVGRWLSPLHDVAGAHAAELAAIAEPDRRWSRLCELNVHAQVEALSHSVPVLRARARGEDVRLHGWIYDLRDGLLQDLEVRRR